MSHPPKVLVASASPDRVNHNAVLRQYVARGFMEVLGPSQVVESSFDRSEAAAREFSPDVVLVFGSCMPGVCDYTRLRRYCDQRGAALFFWLHDDPYEFDFNYKILPYADAVFSNDRWAVSHIDHPHVLHLPLAADRLAHFCPLDVQCARDLFFCGAAFPNRVQLLRDLQMSLGGMHVEVFGPDWPADLSFAQEGRLANEALPAYYASSRVTLNVGRRFNLANAKYQLDASTPGPRTFEAAMAGAVQCLFVEGAEIEDYFVPGQEILLFDTPDELRLLIEELRDVPARRESISAAAQARAMRDHTYASRARVICALYTALLEQAE